MRWSGYRGETAQDKARYGESWGLKDDEEW